MGTLAPGFGMMGMVVNHIPMSHSQMYLCFYIVNAHVYVCMCVCVYACLCRRVHMHVCTHVYACTCMQTHTHIARQPTMLINLFELGLGLASPFPARACEEMARFPDYVNLLLVVVNQPGPMKMCLSVSPMPGCGSSWGGLYVYA